jgi:hypothetical protein
VGDGEGQREQKGIQDLHLLDGLLARGRQDAQCIPGSARKMDAEAARQKARKMKGGGAGNARVAARVV